MPFRYEDLALNEMEMALKIYNFIGHDIHQDVIDTIKGRRRRRRSYIPEMEKLHKMNIFGVNKSKNESSIANLKSINQEEEKIINDLCYYYYKEFKYDP